jgi:hypothetical protein
MSEDEVTPGPLGQGVDEVRDGFTGLLGCLGTAQVALEDGHDLVGEPGEGLLQQFVDAAEVVGHRAERHPGPGGDPAVGDTGDALVGDVVERGGENALASLRISVPGGHVGRLRRVRSCGRAGRDCLRRRRRRARPW